MTLQEIIDRLEGVRKSGSGFTARCPAHEDRKNSLSVCEAVDGKILFYCHAGCTVQAVVAAINLNTTDLFPNQPPELHRLYGNGIKIDGGGEGIGAIDKIYRYENANGELVYENVRFHPTPNATKRFAQRRPDGNGGKIWGLGNVERVPYRLPDILTTMRSPSPEIWFTEGEKDADNLRALGFTATSFKNWIREFNKNVRNAHAVLFCDHDNPGLRQANAAAQTISEVAETVKVIDLFTEVPLSEKHGRDVSDWIEARQEEGLEAEEIAEQLAQIVDRAAVWTGAGDAPLATGLEIEYLNTVTARDIAWFAEPLIPFGFFTLLDGIEGIGKTYAMLDLAKRLTCGERMPFSGEVHEPSNVLFLSIEDSPEYILKPRFEKMHGDCSRLAVLRGHFDFTDAGFRALEQTIEKDAIKFVLIDPLFSFTGRADINNTSDVRPITDRLNKLAATHEIVIVGVRHINKSKGNGELRNAGAHSVAWLQGCRSGLMIGHDVDDKSKRGIAQHKLNIAPESKTVYGFELDPEGIFHWTGVSDLSVSAMLAKKGNEAPETRSKVDQAIHFLREALAGGPMLKKDLDIAARDQGISPASLNRAKEKLNLQPKKTGFGDGWMWELAEDAHEDPQDLRHANLAHLRSAMA